VETEPRLAALEKEIRSVRRTPGKPFCANAVWYGYGGRPSFKEKVTRLVGWEAKNPKVATRQAYDAAYHYCYSLLPDCERGCACDALTEALVGWV
jgi:hypothetical protein